MSESRKTMNLFKQLSPANKRELCSQWNHNETESVFVEYHYLWISGCFASKNKMCWWRSHLKIWYCNFPEEWRITAVNRMCSINWFAQLKHEAQQFLHLIVISNSCTLQHQGSIKCATAPSVELLSSILLAWNLFLKLILCLHCKLLFHWTHFNYSTPTSKFSAFTSGSH